MIPIFRKTRKKMVGKDQNLNYAKYAFGEIVLVVLGILIALQINNWNAERKNEKLIRTILKEVQNDLLLNLREIENVMAGDRKMDSLLRHVYFDQLTLEDYKQSNDLYYAALTFTKTVYYDNGFSKLNNRVDNIPAAYNDVFNKLKLIFEKIEYETQIHQQIIDNVEANHKYLEFNTDWYSVKTDEEWLKGIDFFLHNPIYQNMVTYLLSHLDDNKWLYTRDIIIEGYISLSRQTGINELPGKYDVFLNPDLESYVGVYHYKDSVLNLRAGQNTITLQNGILSFNTNYSSTNLYLESKDIFYYQLINKKIVFIRDSLGQVIGLNRNHPRVANGKFVWDDIEMKKIK